MCKKSFNNPNVYLNHIKSKKHLDAEKKIDSTELNNRINKSKTNSESKTVESDIDDDDDDDDMEVKIFLQCFY